MNARAFREYDIRGIADKEIRDPDVITLGRALGTYMARRRKSHIVLGRDCRVSSDRYRDLLLEGLLSSGIDVVDIGVCPTPVCYFAIRHLEREGGVMITASHNPSEYNGFKICNGFDAISGEEIQKLRMIMDSGDFESGHGQVCSRDVIEHYAAFILGNIAIKNALRVGVDAGNATGGPVALPILRKLGCEVHPIHCTVDGTFPNHSPDPTITENLEDLRDLVRREHLDVGMAYDGDCDRVAVVDSEGEVVYGDRLMILFSREILARNPGATFVYDVKCSKILFEDTEKRGGRAIMGRTGHSLIKAKMKETDAIFGGEMNGHLFFKDRYFGFDDGIYASCRLIEILTETGKTISELLEGTPLNHTTPEIRVPCPEEIKFEVIERARRCFLESGHDVIDVDGARIVFPDGWGLVRASNTQPILVFRYEAETPERLEALRELIEGTIERVKRELWGG